MTPDCECWEVWVVGSHFGTLAAILSISRTGVNYLLHSPLLLSLATQSASPFGFLILGVAQPSRPLTLNLDTSLTLSSSFPDPPQHSVTTTSSVFHILDTSTLPQPPITTFLWATAISHMGYREHPSNQRVSRTGPLPRPHTLTSSQSEQTTRWGPVLPV